MTIKVKKQNVLRFYPKSLLSRVGNGKGYALEPGEYITENSCILFSDVRDFTTISESLSSAELFLFMNEYVKHIVPTIYENNGIIDKFIGDAFLALFPSSSNFAVHAAIALQRQVEKFNDGIHDKSYHPVGLGTGIHKGEVAIGIIGNESINQMAILGDAVNLSSRIEGVTKTYKVPVIISSSVYADVKEENEFLIREIDTVRVKGKEKPIVLYEVFNSNSQERIDKKLEMTESYKGAIDFYKKGDFEQSKDLFENCLDILPDDSIPQIYIKRCGTFTRMPPGDDWSGITGIL